MLGRTLTAIAILLAVSGLAWALWPRPITVQTATVQRGTLEVMVEEEGESRIREVFTVSMPVTGQLQRLGLHAGDEVVAEKTIVAAIRPVDPSLLDARSRLLANATVETAFAAVDLATAQAEQAEKQLSFAERALERTVLLSQRELVSAQVLERAQFDFDLATTAMQSARAALRVRQRELTSAEAALVGSNGSEGTGTCCVEVKAPVSGRILQVLAESEQVVQAGTPLLSIGDPRNLEVAVDLLSRDAVRLQPGAAATIDGWGGTPLAAELVHIEPVATTKVSALGIEERRTTAKLALLAPAEQWQRLGHGFRIVAHIVRWQAENVLTVPIGALFRVDSRWAVFVVENGQAVTRQIEIGERNSEAAEVVAGLAAGEEVILHPADTISSGTAVSVLAMAEGDL